MAGRFALFTDENVGGPLVRALKERGWDVQRAIDVFGETTDDEGLFAYASEDGRVFVTDDRRARLSRSAGCGRVVPSAGWSAAPSRAR